MTGIGLDFGTTNTTLAVLHDGELTYLDIDAGSDNPKIMPTALYLTRQIDHLVGSSAIKRYLSDNSGRSVRLQRIDVGEITMTFSATDTQVADKDSGDTTTTHRVTGYEDSALPGRLFRGLKTFLGVVDQPRFKVFDRQFHIVALITLILREIREFIVAQGNDGTAIHIGRPVQYGAGPAANETALRRMEEACRNAGFEDFVFFPEPVAASLSYLQHHQQRPRRLLTFDFGGGTLDLCLLDCAGEEFKVLGTAGLAIGGNRIDQMIMESLVFPQIGQGCLIKSSQSKGQADTEFPFYQYSDYLLNWQTAYMINQPALLETVFSGMRSGAKQRTKLARLWKLIRGNHAYSLLNATETAKAALSQSEQTVIELKEIDLAVPMSRGTLEGILAPVVGQIQELVDSLLKRTGTQAGDIERVVCTGGSSQLVPVQRMLERQFSGRIVKFDYYRSIAAGLAIANAERYDAVLV